MDKILILTFSVIFSTLYFCQDINCDKIYQEEKKKHEDLYGDIQKIDTSELDRLIINSLDLKKIDKKNLILFYKHEYEICGIGSKSYCKKFQAESTFYEKLFTSKKLWNLDNILYLQKIIKKNIVPVITSGNYSLNSESEMLELSKNKISLFKKSNIILSPAMYDGSKLERTFYYLPFGKRKLELYKMGDLYFKDCNIVETNVEHKSSKEIKITVKFYDDEKKNYILNYVYDDVKKWKLAN